MDPAAATAVKPPESSKSFMQALSSSCELQLNQLPPNVVMGNFMRVKISQAEYESGIAAVNVTSMGKLLYAKEILH